MLEQTRQGCESSNGTNSARFQGPPISKYRTISDSVVNQVITLPISGEIFSRVVNDMVCTNGAHHIQIPRTAYARNFSAERFGKLNRKCTHATSRPIHQNLLSGLDMGLIAKTSQRSDCRHWDGCR